MSEQFSSLTTELTGSVAIIRFNRPAERNPLSIATLNELRTSFSTAAVSSNVEAIIFTGADEVFAYFTPS
jgi:enoyl-CoA hydratase/carnithine racemase